jgi:small subunit ribosomal protein S16
MVVIRLARIGSLHKPKYRVMVADSRRYRNSRFIEAVGFYIPKPGPKEESLKLDLDKIGEWVKKGAQPTERVKSLLRQAQGTAKKA